MQFHNFLLLVTNLFLFILTIFGLEIPQNSLIFYDDAACGTRTARWLVSDPAWVLGRDLADDPSDGDAANLSPIQTQDPWLFDGNFYQTMKGDSPSGCGDWSIELDLGQEYDLVGFMLTQNGRFSAGQSSARDVMQLQLQYWRDGESTDFFRWCGIFADFRRNRRRVI